MKNMTRPTIRTKPHCTRKAVLMEVAIMSFVKMGEPMILHMPVPEAMIPMARPLRSRNQRIISMEAGTVPARVYAAPAAAKAAQ